MESIESISAEQWGIYAATCELYPGDVVATHLSVRSMDPLREWVVDADWKPYGEPHWTVPLIGVDENGQREHVMVSSRTLLRLIRRGGIVPCPCVSA